MILFEDYFTGGIKPEWNIISGTWIHNSEFDALQTSQNIQNQIKVNIVIPDNILIESKIIKVPLIQNTSFGLLIRSPFLGHLNEGYSLSYIELYSRLDNYAFFLIRWENGVMKGELASCFWSDLGLSGIEDLEGKTIGIKVEGNVIKGYLDGIEILSAIDDVYPSGQAGIYAQPRSEAFIFDDFKIADTVVETPPIEETKQLEVLEAGEENNFIYTKPELAITDITVIPKESLNNVAITIKELTTNPQGIEPAKKVFKYLEISKDNIEDADIDVIKINFRVPKVWIIENKLCEIIFLYRYTGSEWIKCNMNKIRRDKEFHYYEAQTTTLSDFGMGGNPGC